MKPPAIVTTAQNTKESRLSRQGRITRLIIYSVYVSEVCLLQLNQTSITPKLWCFF